MAAEQLKTAHNPFFFLEKPPPNEVQKFKEHVKTTGYPETYPRLDNSPTRDIEGAEILTEFTVDRKKRTDGDEAPCPICSPYSPKYLAGYLVWFPKEGTIRAIGRECGKAVNEKWAKEQWAFKQREKQEARERYLFENFHGVPELLSRIEEQARIATSQHQTWLEFRKNCAAIVQYLRTGMQSGRLTVAEKRSSSSGRGLRVSGQVSNYTEVTVGFANGQTAVKSSYSLHKKLEEHVRHLSAISMGSDPEVTGLKICDMKIHQMKTVEKLIKSAVKAESSAKKVLKDFDAFFSNGTIELLNKWANHESSSCKFTLEVTPTGRSMKVYSPEFGFSQIQLYHRS